MFGPEFFRTMADNPFALVIRQPKLVIRQVNEVETVILEEQDSRFVVLASVIDVMLF